MKINVDELVDAGLVKKKEYTEGKYAGLSVLKYTKKVFFKSLWNLSDKLLECRGTVVDQEDNIIVRPFKKIFNLGENGTTVEPYSYIIAPRKINGFLGCVTRTEKYGMSNVIVHNTLASSKELSPYLYLAEKHNYKVVSLIVENRHGNSSVHNVPKTALDRQRNKLMNSIKL